MDNTEKDIKTPGSITNVADAESILRQMDNQIHKKYAELGPIRKELVIVMNPETHLKTWKHLFDGDDRSSMRDLRYKGHSILRSYDVPEGEIKIP